MVADRMLACTRVFWCKLVQLKQVYPSIDEVLISECVLRYQHPLAGRHCTPSCRQALLLSAISHRRK